MTAGDSSSANSPTRRPRASSTAPAFLATPAPNQNALAEERRRLDEDIAELRQTEANLQAYEKRLRALQAEIEAAGRRERSATQAPVRAKGRTKSPFAGNADELKEGWEKLIRAREILEVEQAHVRGDRLALSDETAVVRRRAQAVAEREVRVTEREQNLEAFEADRATAVPPAPGSGDESAKAPHMLAKMTMAPFSMGRSLLRRSK